MALPDIVPREEWQAARDELLAEEKALMKARDALAAKRRRLPMTPVRGDYRFVGPDGEVDLLGLFAGRRQLIVYRFFYAPDVENWPEGACSGCSLFADTVVHPAHLAARDTTLVFVSAAPQERIAAYKTRMGWEELPFFTLVGEEFSRDFAVEEMFGLTVFIRDGDSVFQTYFVNGRGIEEIGPVWSFLDITPLGRQEEWQEVPPGRPQGPPYEWWRLHDNYGDR
ncbi:DUF899 domain-containing protein [Mycobacterium manitobense]|uniref:DUF899 domain-containing protein n=1 Tax=[Mycobacterium] manitobense TaxID=190147 RepID=A0A9X2YLI4_9MYCO|nr:DUF899 domain-containing protein [[Mycobacterium] manitobense]MCV7170128.1 DUF899 domain-containing protein [[Mycobacterium] manitobense]